MYVFSKQKSSETWESIGYQIQCLNCGIYLDTLWYTKIIVSGNNYDVKIIIKIHSSIDRTEVLKCFQVRGPTNHI